jgi:tyrosyl-tRNA synthetase
VEAGALHPMEVKKSLGAELVTRYHGAAAAESARKYFEARHQNKTLPSDIRKQFSAPEPIWICRLLVDLDFAKSGSEARRLIAQGAVRIDGRVVTDVDFYFDGALHRVIEVGKNRIAQLAR